MNKDILTKLQKKVQSFLFLDQKSAKGSCWVTAVTRLRVTLGLSEVCEMSDSVFSERETRSQV